jgi:hypothetical protein
MCGIVTLMSTEQKRITIDQKKFLTQGIMIDSLRGDHSTGLAYVDKAGHSETYKRAVSGYDFVSLRTPQRVLENLTNYNYIIAHNRYATKGSINSFNAHPFTHGKITGVHNGGVSNYWKLAPNKNFGTDSEHVIWALSQCNSHDEVGEIIKQLDGAFVLVWHDSTDNTIHYVRNQERPFSFAFTQEGNAIYGISERKMLELLVDRNKIKVDQIVDLPNGEEWIFNLDDLSNPTKIERELYVRPPVINNYSNNYGNNYNRRYHGRGSNRVAGKQEATVTKLSDVNRAIEDRAIANKLAQYDLSVGQTVQFIIQEFEPYPGQTSNSIREVYGCVHGWMLDDPFLQVKVNGVSEKDYDSLVSWEAESTVLKIGIRGVKEWLELSGNKLTGIVSSSSDGDYDDLKYEEDETVDNLSDPADILYVDSRGKAFTHAQATEVLKHGCGLCGTDLEPEDLKDNVSWIGEDPVCSSCFDKLHLENGRAHGKH